MTVQQMQKKRFKYEKEKRPEQIFTAKWCEGRPWLKYDRDDNKCNNFRSSAVSDHEKSKGHLNITYVYTCRLVWNKNYVLSEISVKVFKFGRKLVGPAETDIV